MTDADGSLITADAVNEMVRTSFPGSPNRCTGLGDGWATARSDVRPESIRPGGFISGPTQFGLADSVLWYLVFTAIGRIEPMALTSELSIRFLRPAQGSTIHAKAVIESVGSRTIVGSVTVWTDDETRPTSVAQGSYVLPR